MKKSIKRTLAILLTLVLALGIGIPAFAAPAAAAAPAEEKARKFEPILLLPYIGPVIYYFRAGDRTAALTVSIVSFLSPIIGALLHYFNVI